MSDVSPPVTSCTTCSEVFPTLHDLEAHCLAKQHAYFSYKCGSCDDHYSTLEHPDQHTSSHDFPVAADSATDEVDVHFATLSSFDDSDRSDSGEPRATRTLEEEHNEASSEDLERLSSRAASYVTMGSIISSIPGSGLEDVVEGWDNLSSGLASAGASRGPPQDPFPGFTAIENSQPNLAPSLGLPAYFQEIMRKYFVWPCSTCNRLFPTERILHDHQQQKHLAVVAIHHSSPQANRSESDSGLISVDGGFFDANRANTALETAYANASFPNNCSICGKRFRDAKALDTHRLSSPQTHRFFQCSLCRELFKTIVNLQRHREAKHKISLQQPMESPQRTGLRLQAHTLAPIPQPPPPPPSFICKSCGKDMANADALTSHELSAPDGHKPFQCTSCSKGYWTQYGLDAYRFLEHSVSLLEPTEIPQGARLQSQAHTPAPILQPPLPRFECKICGKTMSNAASLQVHEASRAKRHRILKCSSCSKAFSNKKDLENHRLSKHSGPVEVVQHRRSFKCTVCGKEFGKSKKLRAHVLSEANSHSTWMGIVPQITFGQITGPVAPPKKVVVPKATRSRWNGPHWFQCLVCSKGFKKLDRLINHLRSPVHDQK